MKILTAYQELRLHGEGTSVLSLIRKIVMPGITGVGQ